MAVPCKLLFSLLTFFFLICLVHGKLTVHPSDLKAFNIIKKDLGIKRRSNSPCSLAGVLCERRLSDNDTYALRITRLTFKSEGLAGFLSPAIGRLTELRELSVSGNYLVDQIPAEIVDCRKLEILDLQKNLFSGEVPTELSRLPRLRVLDLSSNEFSGNLSFLKYLPNLEILSVADNHFDGKIPTSIRSLHNLRVFNFSGNQFLEGSMPLMKGVEYSAENVARRYMLAGAPDAKMRSSYAPAPALSAPAPAPGAMHHHKHRNNGKKIISWILGFIAGAIAGSISGFIASLIVKTFISAIRGARKGSGAVIFGHLIKKSEHLAFLEKEDGLAALEIIGKGGCGEVYKAELPGSNGKMIAIKKIIQPPKEASELADEDSKLMTKKMRQIKSEITTVGKIRHRNLLSLMAHVPRPDCHYLVYEYMKNGSLQDVLNKVSEGTFELDWLTRHKIALGVASGLEYLHMSHTSRIIHRDLKPANILLDDDMEARIADFGLAKAIPDQRTHFTTSNVAGTVGYIAPEYHQTLKFTDKCDIYSFGVVLGVLVTGKLPSDEFFRHTAESLGMVKWMRTVIASENPREAIDPKLLGNGWEEQMLLVLKIACFCTLDNPKERPNSKEVRCMLSQIKHEAIIEESPSENV